MKGFDFLLVLLSFVYALALGHVLSNTGRLVIERHRVRFSGLLALAILNAVTQVYICWLGLWDFRETSSLDLYTVTLLFLSSILIYGLCIAVSPEPRGEGEVDLEGFYWRNYRLFYGAYAVLILLFVAQTILYLRTPHPELFTQQALANAPFMGIALFALLVRARRAQWAAGTAMFVLSVAWVIVFSPAFS